MSGANVKIEHEPTPKQRDIVESIDGNLLVLAAVGSGKTSVLAWRIAHAIKNGIDAKRILALTFTNLAARQIRGKVNEIVGPPASHASIRTFHSLCAWVLRTHCSHFGLDPDFSIYDEADSSELIEKLGVDTERYKAMHGLTPLRALQKAVSEVGTGHATWEGYRTASFIDEDWARRYIESLMEVGAVDFSGLVYLTRALFNEDEEVRTSWQQRFSLINVDEVQDTHVSEYEVVRTLSHSSRSTCFFGDPFQTIYEWRGSQPEKLFEAIRSDYAPVKEIALSQNHRATRQLIKLSRDVAKSFGYTYVLPEPAAGASEGSKPEVRRRHVNLEAEIEAVTMRCRGLIQNDGIEPNKIAVLARSNKIVSEIAECFRKNEIKHCTTEQSQFFRQSSIKDILALMRLSLSPRNEAEARRLISRMNGVSEPLNGIRRDIVRNHLRFYDFLDTTNLQTGDPLSGFDADECVVMDTETTGVDVDTSEVIEIAASRLRANVVVETFHRFICPEGDVGDSEQVHGHSDEFLRTNGEDAATVFRGLADFVGYTQVTGHNIRSFDARIIESHARGVGVPISLKIGIDTLEASRKMLKLSDYRLGTVAQFFGIDTGREHSAYDDTNTTRESRSNFGNSRMPVAKSGAKFTQHMRCCFCLSGSQSIGAVSTTGTVCNCWMQRFLS